MLPGVCGALISTDFLERLLFRQFGASFDELEGAAARKRLASWWRTVEARHGPASSVRALLDEAATPLAETLGFHVTRIERADDLFVVSLTREQCAVPLL